MNKTIPIITLDGPSGTGKGTLCHRLAKHLGWHMLDSGAIYRVLAYAAKHNRVSLQDVDQLIALARSMDLRFSPLDEAEPLVLLDNQNITSFIRSEQCGQDASQIAVIPAVRHALLERQRSFAEEPGLVTDGRDMGTIVFPHATLKLYLYATEEERAKRRYLQLQEKQINVSLAQVVEELAKRDTRDTSRSCSPLKPADDSIKIDTTGLSVDQVFVKILYLIDKCFSERKL